MGLEGLTVAVTGSRRASELAQLITNLGGVPYVAPTVGIEVHADADRETEGLIQDILGRQIRYAIFMTGPGGYRLMSTAARLGAGQEGVGGRNRPQVSAGRT